MNARMKARKCPACGEKKIFRTDVKTCGCRGTNPNLTPVQKTASGPVELSSAQKTELELQRLRDKRDAKDHQIGELAARVLDLEKELELVTYLKSQTPQAITIKPSTSHGTSESAAVAVWSDHHSEERVLPGQVGGRNEHNLEVNDRRFQKLVHGTLAWFNIERAKTTIKNLTIAMLGDFITGSIHADLSEANLLQPTEAIYRVQNQLIGGLQFIRDNTPRDVKITVVCHGGNHGRMTKDQRIATETGNSLEQYMYYTIRDFFKDDSRFEFVIATGYHTFVTYFDNFKVRFHHGHQINYQGGVGGITIPVNKAIAQWNKANPVNLDVFGHFHTRFDGGNFICNGSLIGYNAYALSIKASFEKPSQTFFLINKEYGEKTMVAPIFVD
jgi:hypothetical protein